MRPNPNLSPAVRIAAQEEGLLAYQSERDVVHELNRTAALVLMLCDGRHDESHIEAALHALAGEACPALEVAAWLATAEADGLVRRDGTTGTRPLSLSAKRLDELARRLHEDGERHMALRCQQAATALAPEEPDLWWYLCQYARELDEQELAREALIRYREHYPDDPVAAHLVAALSGGEEDPPRMPDACVRQIFDAFADDYDRLMVEDLEYCAHQLLADALARLLPAPAATLRVADLGCGTGLLGPLVKPWARQLVGVDLSPAMASQACATGDYDEIHIASLTDWLARVERPFDLLVSADVVIYLGDLLELTSAAYNALVPGGHLCFTVERHLGHGFVLTASGRYAHSRGYLEQVAADAGLRVCDVSTGAIRLEDEQPVRGLILILERPPAQSSRLVQPGRRSRES